MARDALLFKKVIEEKEKRRWRFFKDEKARDNMRRVMEEQEEERRLKALELIERQKNLELRIKRVKEMKEEKKREVARKARARQEVIRKRVEASKEIAMMKKVKNLKRMRLEDIRMKRSLQQAKDDRIQNRREKDLYHWNELKRSQEERQRLQAEMIEAYTQNVAQYVARDLREKAATQKQRDRQLKVIQMTNMNSWADKERDYARELRHKLMKRWRDKQAEPPMLKEKKPYPPRPLLREAVHSGVCGRSDSAATLDRAERWMQQWENVPVPVRSILNAAMARAILHQTTKDASDVLKTAYDRALRLFRSIVATHLAKGAPPPTTGKKQKKKAPEATMTDSQQDMEDAREEREASSEMERSLVRSRRVMTQVITEHARRGLDPENLIITTMPRLGTEPKSVTEDAKKLAMLVCHTRAADISISTDLVKAAAEKVALLALKVMQKERNK